MIPDERYRKFLTKTENIKAVIDILQRVYLGKRKEVEEYLTELGFNELKGGVQAFEILKRPNIKYREIAKFIPDLQGFSLDDNTVEEIEIIAKYEGYINKQKKEAESFAKMDMMKIPEGIDYLHMDGLALEARSKLNQIQPLTIGQASRISGVNPADISILILNIKKEKHHE